MEKDDKRSVTNKWASAWLTLGVVCLVVFLLLLDKSALSIEIAKEANSYIRQLVMLFIVPFALLAFLVRHYRYRIAEFWFRWGVPFSLSAIILILVLPSVLPSLVEYMDANAESQLSIDNLLEFEDTDSKSQNETPTPEPPDTTNVDATYTTTAVQHEIDNSDNKLYWLVFSFGMALTLAGAVLYSLSNRKLTRATDQEPEPLHQEVDSLSRVKIKSTQHYSDVVTQTFHQLVQLAGQKSGVTLGQTVTASEFQATLQKQGFPETALQVITHAFEQVRYGHHKPSREQISQVELAIANIHGHLNMDGEDHG